MSNEFNTVRMERVNKSTSGAWNMIIGIAIALCFLIIAIWQAFQGDWAPAIFFAILWHGYSNNSNAASTNFLIGNLR